MILNETVHDLKIMPQYFWAVKTGIKGFEIRRNDREFQVGDILRLREYKDGHYTGRLVLGRITFITSFEQKEDYVVLNFKRLRLEAAV
ncbi:ASCH/PUA domain-containing protein [Bacillus altitudinis]|uniref:ASCH/PUA domain-containing protein n=1 Tax=Bacillus TaxID=1386 RepID=UPI003981F5FB